MREISKEFHAFFLKKREQKNGYKSISYNFYYLMDWTDNSRRNCRKKEKPLTSLVLACHLAGNRIMGFCGIIA